MLFSATRQFLAARSLLKIGNTTGTKMLRGVCAEADKKWIQKRHGNFMSCVRKGETAREQTGIIKGER